MLKSNLGRVFVMSLAISCISWFGAFAFASLAGESAQSIGEKLSQRANSSVSAKQNEDLNLEGVEMIEVRTSSEAIDLQVTDSKIGSARYVGQTSEADRKPLKVERSGSLLKVYLEQETKHFFWLNLNSKKVESKVTLVLPLSYRQGLRLNSSSGDIEGSLKGLRLSEVSLALSSGDVDLKDISTDSGSINSSSGDIKLRGWIIEKGRLRANSSSGEITIKNTDSKEIEINTTSGEIDIADFKTESLKVNSTSGDVSIHLDDKSPWEIETHSTSGSIHNKTEANLKGASTPVGVLKINTTSGDISILR